jgi:hypothetical protein
MKRSDPDERLRKAKAANASPARTQEILGILHKWGIHTHGQLAALDKEELAGTAPRFRKR